MTAPLVSTEWLETHLGEPSLRIVELRGGVLPATEPPPHYVSDRAGYEAAHIPGAVFIDWKADIVDPASPSYDIASPERFAELMGRLGIDNATYVIAYDNSESSFAARLLWCLRYYGHDKVSVLDGGWLKWSAEGRPIESVIPNVPVKIFIPRINPRLKATAAEILAAIPDRSLQLVDTRSPAEFTGEASRANFGGHIPSAVNLHRSTLVAEDKTLKPADELRSIMADAGLELDAGETVVYCNAGVSAAYGMLAMEVAGARDLRLYDGSWREWGNDASKPIAR